MIRPCVLYAYISSQVVMPPFITLPFRYLSILHYPSAEQVPCPDPSSFLQTRICVLTPNCSSVACVQGCGQADGCPLCGPRQTCRIDADCYVGGRCGPSLQCAGVCRLRMAARVCYIMSVCVVPPVPLLVVAANATIATAYLNGSVSISGMSAAQFLSPSVLPLFTSAMSQFLAAALAVIAPGVTVTVTVDGVQNTSMALRSCPVVVRRSPCAWGVARLC